MVLQGIDRNKNDNLPNPVFDSQNISSSQSCKQYFTTMISKGEAKEPTSLSDSFKKIWEYIQWPFIKIWEYIETPTTNFWNWIKWVAQGCPKEKSSKEVLSDIITDPKKTAKQYGASPIENIGKFIVSVLSNREQIEKMRKDSKAKWENFLKAFADELPKESFSLSTEDNVQALRALINPTKRSKINLFNKLKDAVKKNRLLFQRSLIKLSEKILTVIGKEDLETNQEEVKHLRRLCGECIPKVVEFLEKNPAEFGSFIEGVYHLTKIEKDQIIHICQKYLEIPSEYADSLQSVFQEPGQTSNKLNIPRLFFDENLKTTPGMEKIPMAFYQSILEEILPEEIDTFIEAIGTDFPLLTTLLQDFKELEANKRHHLAKDLPKTLVILTDIKKELEGNNNN